MTLHGFTINLYSFSLHLSRDRKSTRLNSSHVRISYAVFCLKKKTLATIEALTREFTRWGMLRGDLVMAAGGGVVGDTAGFAAAVYYRVVAVVHVLTTLLAMV